MYHLFHKNLGSNQIITQIFLGSQELFPKNLVIILLKSKKYCVILKTKGVIYLPDKELGQCLKKAREDAGISVEEISNILTSMGFKAGRNTIYNWEGGISQPTPDALLHMCRIYNIKDILSFWRRRAAGG